MAAGDGPTKTTPAAVKRRPNAAPSDGHPHDAIVKAAEFAGDALAE